MNALVAYLKNVRTEMNHVVWPDWRQALWHTVVIIVLCAITAAFIAGLDYAFTGVVNRVVTGG
jgi:preprotein translocase SecE subunit